MKKIVFMHHVSSVGGGSFCLLNLLKSVDRSLFEPIVLLKEDGPLFKEIEKLNIRIVLFPQMDVAPYNKSFKRPGTLLTYLSVYSSRFPLLKKLQKLKPDILYLNNSMLYPYLKVAKQIGVKTIIHIREHWPLNEHRYQLHRLQDNIRKYSDRIVAINEYSAKMVAGPNNTVQVVYDWVDFTNRIKEYNLNEIFGEDVSGLKIYLYTGGMQAIKGCREVLKVFSSIKDDKSRLLALGVDYSQREIANILNNDKRIVPFPYVYEIKNLLEKCYCVLSYFTIPHANLAMAEAIILKTPVIAARTEESEEYSNGGELAILFEINNINEFRKAIEHFPEQRDILKCQLNRKSAVIATKFNKERNAQLFRDLLSTM